MWSLLPTLAFAVDGWSEPFPGVRVAETVRPGPTRAWVAAIDTCAPGVSFRFTSPDDFAGQSRVTSAFASATGVQLATNGDFFDHDFGMNVGGSTSWEGRASVSPARDTATSGTFAVGADHIELYPTDVVFPGPEAWMEEVLGGRWTLLREGEGAYGFYDGGYICAPGLRHPRTVVGVSGDRRTVFLVVGDGRGKGGSVGLTCDEAIDLLLEVGASDAVGLDGGGSSTMVLDGAVMNLPSDGRERSVLNHLGVYATGEGPAPHCGERAATAFPGGPVGRVTPSGPASRLQLGAPVRLLDTREGRGVVRAGEEVVVPTSAPAVLWNVTTTQPAGPGFLTAWPDGQAAPFASVLNWAPGEDVGNAVIVGANGAVRLRPSVDTHLVVDEQGALGPDGWGFVPLAPQRLLDTRGGGRLAGGEVRRIVDPLVGPVTLSVVVADPAAPGFVTVWPCDQPAPPTSNLNFAAHEVAMASVTVDGSQGGVCARSLVDTDLVVDATGVWTDDGLDLTPVVPSRLLDTRSGEGRVKGRVKPGQVVSVDLGGLPGWPTDGEAAAVVLTVTEPTAPGYLQVWPCDAGRPATSASNFVTGQTVAVSAIVGGGSTRSLCLSPSASLHLVVDLQAVLTGPPQAGGVVGDYRSADGASAAVDGPEAGVVASPPRSCDTGAGAPWWLAGPALLVRRRRPSANSVAEPPLVGADRLGRGRGRQDVRAPNPTGSTG